MNTLRYKWSKKKLNFNLTFPKYLGSRIRYWVLNYEGARHIANNEIIPEVEFCTILKRSFNEAVAKGMK